MFENACDLRLLSMCFRHSTDNVIFNRLFDKLNIRQVFRSHIPAV